MSRPPKGSYRALRALLEDADPLCPCCPAGEFTLEWDPWKDRFRIIIWHDPRCRVPEARTWARHDARKHLKRVLAPAGELAVYLKHRAA